MSLFSGLTDLNGFEGTESSGSSAVNTVVSIGSELIPIPFVGKLLEGLLGSLNIGATITAMSKYGWDAWGASWTPESAKGKWGKVVLPMLESKIENIGQGDLAENINDLYLEMQGNYQTYMRLSKTFSANSSRLAMKWAAEETQKMMKEIFDSGFIPELKKAGVVISKEKFRSRVNEIDGENYLWEQPLNHIESYDFYRYKMDASNMNNVEMNEEGEITSTGGGFGKVIKWGGIALAAAQAFK